MRTFGQKFSFSDAYVESVTEYTDDHFGFQEDAQIFCEQAGRHPLEAAMGAFAFVHAMHQQPSARNPRGLRFEPSLCPRGQSDWV